MRLLWPLLAGAALFLGSCPGEPLTSIAREDLFSLDIGRMEDQVALYSLEGDRGVARMDFAMRDGLFYIADGKGEKIVRYNSYGDLLFMIYNEETNPPPLSLRPMEAGEVVTRWALSYPLRSPGKITVDSRKHIFVEEYLPPERHGYDAEHKALLDNIILHFDAEGRFVEYLGQEGIGGSPFPRISGVYTSVGDELAVVCRFASLWQIYWYDTEGTLLFLVQLQNTAIPVPPDREGIIPSVDTIAVAPDERKLYLKVDYYRDTYDESTNTRSGNEPDSSIIWIMNVEDGLYTGTVEAPFFEYTFTENNRKVGVKMFYSLLGIIKNRRIFLSFPVETGYALLILDSDAPEQRRGFIRVDPEELQFNAFDLSGEGILSALLVNDWDVKLVWWRIDKFIGELSP
ncbi:MAG: hypothetical protein LBT95_00525 [Treponema sp.]|jgi:hypothetical protein|nr:hypothetical protein [Treponema sp.]